MDQAIIDYINKCRSLGHGDESIKSELLKAGYSESDINAAFRTPTPETTGGSKVSSMARLIIYGFLGLLFGPAVAILILTATLGNQINSPASNSIIATSLIVGAILGVVGGFILAYLFTVPTSTFPKTTTLVGRAWSLYKERLPLLATISVIYAVLECGITALIAVIAVLSLAIVAKLILVLALSLLYWFIAAFLSLVALYIVTGDNPSIPDAFSLARDNILPYLWIGVLSALIIAGGGLVLIVPGVIFSLWFLFSMYIFVEQGDRGVAALSKSREYVVGYTRVIFSRVYSIIFLVILIPVTLIPYIVGLLAGQTGKSIASPIVQAILIPMELVYFYVIYRELSGRNLDLASRRTTGARWIIVPFTALGLVAIVVLCWLSFNFLKSNPVMATAPNAIQGTNMLNAVPYTDSANGLSIDLPNGWSVLSSAAGEDVFVLTGEDASNATAIIIVKSNPLTQSSGSNLDTLMAEAIQKIQTLPGYKLISYTDTTTNQGIPARALYFQYTESGQSITNYSLSFISGTNLYDVEGDSISAIWSTYSASIEQSESTITVL